MPVVRLSKGRFSPEQFSMVKDALTKGRETLDPALRRLHGLLHYYVSIDAKTNTMVNVSVWKTGEDANQMNTLKEMLAQRDVFVGMGVNFDPITNYDPLWDVTP
jgi:hypothetical protein